MLLHIISNSSNSEITNIDSECIQPNAVDLRLLSIEHVNNDLKCVVSETVRIHNSSTIISPDDEGFFQINAGRCYRVEFDHIVSIGDGEAGVIITRSTLNRNGLFLQSGLYDAGFNNRVGATLYAFVDAKIHASSRIGQFILFKSESIKLYNGIYNSKG